MTSCPVSFLHLSEMFFKLVCTPLIKSVLLMPPFLKTSRSNSLLCQYRQFCYDVPTVTVLIRSLSVKHIHWTFNGARLDAVAYHFFEVHVVKCVQLFVLCASTSSTLDPLMCKAEREVCLSFSVYDKR